MKKIILCAIICALSSAAATAVYSSSVGTDADPLVSKSYVDAQIADIKSVISNLNTGQSSQSSTQSSQSGTAASSGYTAVSVPVGKIIIGDEGTELILRSGKGSVFITGSDGLADVTTGQNLKNGVSVAANHLLVVPRSDGRGVVVSEAAWFLVKGGYSIQ